MGIRGLETYLERHNTACYRVNVIDLIHKYRKENNSTPIIVVDGMSVIRYLYKFNDLSWICGGQMKEYEESVKDFIKAFQKEGAELVFFFDGPHVCTEREIWIKRRLESIDKVYYFLDTLKRETRIHKLENERFFLTPSNLRWVTMFALKQCGCKVYSSVRKCDLEIAEYGFNYKCMAILAQDSDFVIFKSAKYYLSMKNFNFKSMTTLNYDRDRLASSVGLFSAELPLFASLLGNDIIPFEDVRPFHQNLIYGNQRNYQRKFINFGQLVKEVSHFIRRNVQKLNIDRQILENIALKVFNDISKWEILEQSILSYAYSADINRRPNPPTSKNENWNNILKKAFELHLTTFICSSIYNIIAQKTYSCATMICEDFRISDLPPCQLVLKPLREKLYGVLFLENSEECQIEEWVMCGPQSLDQADYIKPQKPNVAHPGILSLWKGNSSSFWPIIEDIFDVDSLKLRSLPAYLIVPALTLRYLFGKVKFHALEISALLSSIVLLHFYDTNALAALPLPECMRDTRPVRLYALVSRSYSTIIFILNAIGEPIDVNMISPTNYQDGKLFHLKYFQAFKNYGVTTLCDNKQNAVVLYNEMLKFITENNNPLSEVDIN